LVDVAEMRQWDDARLLHDTENPADSFAEFYRRHVGAVLRNLARRGVDAQTAADVTSETFVAALAQRAAYRAENPTGRAWLMGIAQRQLAEVARRGAREHRAQRDAAVDPVVLTEADVHAYTHLLRDPDADAVEILEALPEPQREAIRSRVLRDRAYPDVAKDLDVTETAARKHVSRGLASLRAQLGRKK
jgi:RNA polymerase sigma factor (sigma-70 family)